MKFPFALTHRVTPHNCHQIHSLPELSLNWEISTAVFRLIADLPGNYLNWFAREGFPPGEIGRLLALMQELDHNGLSALLDPLRKRQFPELK